VSDVNRKIAELRGWTDIYEEEWFEDYSNLFGTFPGAVRPMPLPDYYHSLDEAIKAAWELLPGGFTIEINDYGVGLVSWWVGHDKNTITVIPTSPNVDPADIAAALYAAILQAHGVTVEVGE
jgi:hypothetical protein